MLIAKCHLMNNTQEIIFNGRTFRSKVFVNCLQDDAVEVHSCIDTDSEKSLDKQITTDNIQWQMVLPLNIISCVLLVSTAASCATVPCVFSRSHSGPAR